MDTQMSPSSVLVHCTISKDRYKGGYHGDLVTNKNQYVNIKMGVTCHLKQVVSLMVAQADTCKSAFFSFSMLANFFKE